MILVELIFYLIVVVTFFSHNVQTADPPEAVPIPDSEFKLVRVILYRGFWRSENCRHILKKKVLLMTHLPVSPILNAAELMFHLEI